LPNLPQSIPLQVFSATWLAVDPAIGTHETPIQLRFNAMISKALWNCFAAFHPTHLDALTGQRPVAASPNTQHHSDDARLACMAHATAAFVVEMFPFGSADWLAGLPAQLVGMSEADMGLPAELSLDDTGACSAQDSACVQSYLQCQGHTPFAVGKAVAQAMLAFARTDGFNAQGQEYHGKPCTANCRAYSDSTTYIPGIGTSCANVTVHEGVNACWQPLLEDDGKGFFHRQEHVTPHIGTKVTPLTISPAELASRALPPPAYDYGAEADLVLQRLANLTDAKKAAVEFFDDKISVAIALLMAIVTKYGPGATLEKITLWLVGFTAAEYDAALIAWKEKVVHNRVRVTTVLQSGPRVDDLVTTYAGPFAGVQTIARRDVQPWVRTMPHAEYPSGSGCLFQAMYDFGTSALEFLFNDTSPLPVAWPVQAGSSKTEPGVTPASDLVLAYGSLSEMKLAGGESRLDSGVHFTNSVPDSYTLCAGLGTASASWAKALVGAGATASAKGDPHLVNVFGQTFDIMQPGAHVLIRIPSEPSLAGALLRVAADIRRAGAACYDIYIQTLNVTGRWANAEARRQGSPSSGGLFFHAGAAAHRATDSWMALGRVRLKVVHGRTRQGHPYLNLLVRGLKQTGHAVGGLLGEDDHTAASSPSHNCSGTLAL